VAVVELLSTPAAGVEPTTQTGPLQQSGDVSTVAVTEPTTTSLTTVSGVCGCDMAYAPVCGIDGVTYASSCYAQCHGITIFVAGGCHIDEPTPLPVAPLELSAFTLDLEAGTLALVFSRAIAVDSVDASRVALFAAGFQSLHRLAAASRVTGAAGSATAVSVALAEADLDAIKLLRLGQVGGVWLAADAAVARDPVGIASLPGQLPAIRVNPDITAPTIAAVRGSSVDGRVRVTFSEPVDAAAMTPATMALLSGSSACSLLGSGVSSPSARVVVMQLPRASTGGFQCAALLDSPTLRLAAGLGSVVDLAGNTLVSSLPSAAVDATPAAPGTGESSLGAGLIVGIVVGCVGVAAIVLAAIVVRRRTAAREGWTSLVLDWDNTLVSIEP
jgi:hypothetical protein